MNYMLNIAPTTVTNTAFLAPSFMVEVMVATFGAEMMLMAMLDLIIILLLFLSQMILILEFSILVLLSMTAIFKFAKSILSALFL